MTRVLVLLATATVTAAAGGDAAKKEAARFRGAWAVAEWNQGGARVSDKELAAMSVVIEGNRLVLKIEGEPDLAQVFDVDPSKTPKTMDIRFTEDGEKKLVLALYEFDGDRLRICHHGRAPDYAKRP